MKAPVCTDVLEPEAFSIGIPAAAASATLMDDPRWKGQTVFESLISSFQEEAMLRVHCSGLYRCYRKERGIKIAQWFLKEMAAFEWKLCQKGLVNQMRIGGQ